MVTALLIGSYLIGSVPFGLWVAYLMTGVDVRTKGSGNIGATNVWRVCGPKAGIPAFILDVLKGYVPVIVGIHLFPSHSQWAILAGLCSLLGHNFSIFLKFTGGKGIATSLGILLALAPAVAGYAALIFLLELFTLRYISLGDILAAIAVPFLMYFCYPLDHYRLAFGIVASVMAIYKHRSNIARLRAGIEPKVCMPWHKKPLDRPDGG